MSKSKSLTGNQKDMLRVALDRGTLWSGRGGFNEMHVKSLQKLGLVYLKTRGTWDASWGLTELGYTAAKALS